MVSDPVGSLTKTAAPTARMVRRLVLLGLLCLLVTPVDTAAQRIVLLVRHAERADGGVPARMTGAPDPDLSADGRARADRLAVMLADAGITRIIVTEFRRTVQTAAPLAKRLGLVPDRIPAADAAALAARLATYRDDVVLVVGHSNTVPATIAALGGPKLTIAETDYSNLFVYVPTTRVLTRLRF